MHSLDINLDSDLGFRHLFQQKKNNKRNLKLKKIYIFTTFPKKLVTYAYHSSSYLLRKSSYKYV